MSKIIDYKDLFTHRNRSILPTDTQEAVFALGQALKCGMVSEQAIVSFRESLKFLPTSLITRGATEIRDIANLFIFESYILDLLNKYPDLGWLLLFHASGYIREKALQKITLQPNSPFEFAAIVYRLNDWVGNVRIAAREYASKSFPLTSSIIIAESTFFLLSQSDLLSRWSGNEKEKLEDAIFRIDVIAKLKNQFLSLREGRVGFVLRQLLRRSEFDPFLEELAKKAQLPSVRAIAFDTLIMKRAKWPIGYKREWIDKVYNISRRVPDFKTRTIEHSLDILALLSLAALDKSTNVRKVAGTALVSMRNQATITTDEIAKTLSNDISQSVRSRANFYLANKKENNI